MEEQEKQVITTADALRFAQTEIFENMENGNLEFINAFATVALKDLEEKKQLDGETTPIDYIIAGALVGYAAHYMNEQNGGQNVNN